MKAIRIAWNLLALIGIVALIAISFSWLFTNAFSFDPDEVVVERIQSPSGEFEAIITAIHFFPSDIEHKIEIRKKGMKETSSLVFLCDGLGKGSKVSWVTDRDLEILFPRNRILHYSTYWIDPEAYDDIENLPDYDKVEVWLKIINKEEPNQAAHTTPASAPR